jgi:hypothetical protein
MQRPHGAQPLWLLPLLTLAPPLCHCSCVQLCTLSRLLLLLLLVIC